MDDSQDNKDGQQHGAGEVRATARGAAALTASPRIVTTGGNNEPKPLTSPERVELLSDGNGRVYIRTVPDESVVQGVAHIDWLAFTATPPDGESPVWLINALKTFLPLKAIIPTGKGWNGYRERHTLVSLNETDIGLMAFGGTSQRGSLHVELNAQGCSLVTSWQVLQSWGEENKATITRVDLAHDDLHGQELTVATALEWHQTGAFNFNARPAKARLIDDLGTGDGKTLYIGNRANGKMLRIYEKGKQLGDPASPWVRVEAELRNKSRIIPWATLTRPGNYLAGAYPCLAYLSAIQSKIETIRKAVNISYESSVEHTRQTGGKLLNLMMIQNDEDAEAVINQLRREGYPRRLAAYAAHLPNALPDPSP
ncbi:hypothetical protein F8A87_12390 [Betaproteobacteria bacterium SCN2]|jgi:DNA relaxase NicK|nr:hypothetical protein F8A87_12390 [Betaproteobacteria bacterium SCN2]